MTTFQVDPSSLEGLARQLDAVQSQMSQIGDVAARVSPVDLGSLDVYSALQDFHNDWSQGLAKIGGNISGVTDRLTAAAKSYDHAETSVKHAARPQQGGSG